MVEQIIYGAKSIILIEALTHAVRSWEILSPIRDRLTAKSKFIARLLTCYECTAVWTAIATFFYLTHAEIKIITYIIVFHRLSCYLHVAWEILDTTRALKQNQL